jgi:hypothetical protein
MNAKSTYSKLENCSSTVWGHLWELPKSSEPKSSPPDILETKELRKQVEEKNLENKSLRWDFGRIGAQNNGSVSFYSLRKWTRTVGVNLEALKKD